MRRAAAFFLFSIIAQLAMAQEGSDIFLFSFKLDNDQFYLSNPKNITNTPGYDNQPYFMPDSENILYSSDDGFGQTDIYRYSLKAQGERRLTFTPDSEYSPTLTPDNDHFSCVILEKDGNQYLWRYPINGAVPAKVTNVNKIGYHHWINENNVGVFIVEEPVNSLATIQVSTDAKQEIMKGPGRTLLGIPNSNKMSFIDLSDSKNWVIKSYDPSNGQTNVIINSIKGFQDFTWTPNGVLISGDGHKLFKFDPSNDKNWVELADLRDYGLNKFSRMTVSPNGSILALVVAE